MARRLGRGGACAVRLLWVGFVAALAVDRRAWTGSRFDALHELRGRPPRLGRSSGMCSARFSGRPRFPTARPWSSIVFALVRRNLRAAMFLVISVELSGLLTEAAKARREPPATGRGAWCMRASTSFPSGHALGVMVGVLALSTLVLPARAPGAAVLADRRRCGRRARDRGRPRGAERAPPVRRAGRMGAGLRLVRRMPAAGAARRAVRAADETPAAPGSSR